MRQSIRKITPTEATEILEKSDFNRPIMQSHVEHLIGEIINGRYMLNGEPIILGPRGECLDGQHRLWAVVQSGKTIESCVVDGVPKQVFATIDTGRHRTRADTIFIGKKETRTMPVVVRRTIGAAARYVHAIDKNGRFNSANEDPSNRQVFDYAEKHGDIVDDAIELHQLGRWPMPMGQLLAFYHLVKVGFPSALRDFFTPLCNGAGLDKDSPILALRNKATTVPRPTDFRATRSQMACFIKAWNSWVLGGKISVLRFSSGTEDFPDIILNRKLADAHRAISRGHGRSNRLTKAPAGD